MAVLPAALAAGGDGGTGPRSGRLYRATGDPSVTLLRVGETPRGRSLVELAARFECEELALEGVALATVRRDGSFAARSRGFTLAGGGTDQVDAGVTVRGRFRGEGVRGTIAADARAFDNAGTTGGCDDAVTWTGRAGAPDPALVRITAAVRLKPSGSALVAADSDAVYVAAGADDPGTARLHRVDAATGQPVWSARIRTEVNGIAAGAGGIWTIDADENRVSRFDPANGDRVAEIELDPGADESRFGLFAPIATTADAVWLAAPGGGRLYRIDPATNAVTATPAFSEVAEDAVIVASADTVYVGVELPREAAGIPFGIVRYEATTGSLLGPETRGIGQLEAIAPSDAGLWTLLFSDALLRFDAASGAELQRIDVDAAALAAAPPGAWVLTAEGVEAFAADVSSPAVEIPILGGDFGALAATADAIWVWDPRVGVLIRVAATT